MHVGAELLAADAVRVVWDLRMFSSGDTGRGSRPFGMVDARQRPPSGPSHDDGHQGQLGRAVAGQAGVSRVAIRRRYLSLLQRRSMTVRRLQALRSSGNGKDRVARDRITALIRCLLSQRRRLMAS